MRRSYRAADHGDPPDNDPPPMPGGPAPPAPVAPVGTGSSSSSSSSSSSAAPLTVERKRERVWVSSGKLWYVNRTGRTSTCAGCGEEVPGTVFKVVSDTAIPYGPKGTIAAAPGYKGDQKFYHIKEECLSSVSELPGLDEIRGEIFHTKLGKKNPETPAELHRKKVFVMSTLGSILADIRDSGAVARESQARASNVGGIC